jgi:hypothetical protein
MPQFILNEPSSAQHPFYSLNDFARGYVEAMFFTNCDSDHSDEDKANDLGVERLTRDSIASIKADCDAFISYIMPDGCSVQQWLNHIDDYDYDDAQAGRDFWFTRQRHGVGFWNRKELYIDLFESPLGCGGWETHDDSIEQGPYLGNLSDDLATAANSFGKCYIAIDRGWIYYR